MKNKILLTGAFGNVGRSTLDELLKRGYKNIRIFEIKSKENKRIAKRYKKKVDVFFGDLRNPQDVAKSLKDIDVIIHLAAIIPPLADKYPNLAREVNVGGTANLLEEMKKLPIKPKILFSSSISVYGDRLNNPYIKINDPLIPSEGDEYAKTKIAAETLIQNSEFDWAIFRLTYITKLSKLQIDPLLFHMPLDTKIEICCSRDVALAIANAVECPKIWGGIYHIGGGEECRTNFREYLNVMTDLYGLGEKLLPEEAFAKDNFHCGFYETGNSQQLLNYQRHSLKDYYRAVKRKLIHVRRTIKIFYFIVHPIARMYLLSQSKYYKKFKKTSKNSILIT